MHNPLVLKGNYFGGEGETECLRGESVEGGLEKLSQQEREALGYVTFVLIKTLCNTNICLPLLTPPQKSCNFPYLESREGQATSEDKARLSLCFGEK